MVFVGGEAMQRVGLIGDPVAHSRSPAMQNAAFVAVGLDARYEVWPTPAAALAQRVAALRAAEVLGANVTVPHKRAIMPLLDAIAPTAQMVGAVNTIVHVDDRLIGHNTDAEGLAAALRAIGWDDVEMGIVLGAGGAARAAAVALQQLGARTVCVLARQPDQARGLTDELAAHLADVALLWGDLAGTDAAVWRRMLAGADILINATPVGMPERPGIPLPDAVLDLMRAGTLVLDLITNDTPLLAAARARELPALNGLPMLLHQGALAFTLWTGQRAPIEVMWRALGQS
jgi:shikimate dehydrogenase